MNYESGIMSEEFRTRIELPIPYPLSIFSFVTDLFRLYQLIVVFVDKAVMQFV